MTGQRLEAEKVVLMMAEAMVTAMTAMPIMKAVTTLAIIEVLKTMILAPGHGHSPACKQADHLPWLHGEEGSSTPTRAALCTLQGARPQPRVSRVPGSSTALSLRKKQGPPKGIVAAFVIPATATPGLRHIISKHLECQGCGIFELSQLEVSGPGSCHLKGTDISVLQSGIGLVCLLHSADIRRQAPALFTLNLTCGNLLCTVVFLTLAGVVAQRPPAGDRLCRLAAFLDTFLAANSMLSMAALSIDRWVAVVFPLSYRAKMRLRDAALMVAYTWLHALTFPAAALALSWLGFHQLYASCTLCSRRPDERLRFAVFTGAFHALSFLLSFVVLCCTYCKVLKVARFHCKRIDVITMQTLVLLVDIHPSVRERCLEEQKRRRQRATKKISTFIGTFLVCFAPYVITRLVELSSAVPISSHWGVLSKCLAYSKAASDPFVYSLLRHQYRKSCKEILNRVLHRRSLRSSGLTGDSHSQNILPVSE
nr:PREDICTED: G-protein coupled receptor 26 [Bos mutus]